MVYKIFDKKTWLVVSVNEELAKKLNKPVIKKIKKEWSMLDLKSIFRYQV